MKFFTSTITKSFTFHGRATRSEYWAYTMTILVLFAAALALDIALTTFVFAPIVMALSTIPWIALMIRRIHDTGHSGLWLGATFIPFAGTLCMLYFCFKGSQVGPNAWGPEPGARRDIHGAAFA